MLRVGVIGVGSMGQHHARIYSEMDNVELVGVADASQERAEMIGKKYKVLSFIDYKELFTQKLDVVSIAVPTISHRPVGIDTLKHDCHVFIEKPITDSLSNALKLKHYAEWSNLKIMVGHVERFNPAVIKLKQIIQSNLLGDIVSISAKRVGPFNPTPRDVSVILDLGIHDIDIMMYLLDTKPDSVFATAGTVSNNIDDYATVMLKFGAISGICEMNWLTPHKTRTLSIVGTKGVAYLDYINQSLSVHTNDWIQGSKITKSEPLRNELEHFVDCIINNKEPKPSIQDGINALQVALTAKQSSIDNKVGIIS